MVSHYCWIDRFKKFQSIHVAHIKCVNGIARIAGGSTHINGVLLVLDRLRDDLRVEVVVQTVVEMRLDGQRLGQKLLDELLLRRLTENDALGCNQPSSIESIYLTTPEAHQNEKKSNTNEWSSM